jgi:FkbM family methyltransferase
MTRKGSFSEFARRFFRSYRNGRIRIGHSLIRRVLEQMVAKRQEIRLRSGLKLDLDLTKGNQNGVFWCDGDVEIGLYWAIRELVPVGGRFVDCGANCGLMGLLARQYRRARVIFFEPHPRLAKSIEANIRLNRFEDTCELIEAAVSDSSGEVTFYENAVADGSHSIHRDWATDLGEMRPLGKVHCVTLKEIIEAKNLPKIDFLKVDTEGNDYAVLKGLGRYLQPSFTEVIYVEMDRDRETIRDLMQTEGYVGFAPVPRRHRALAQAQQLYERGGCVNFFALLEQNMPLHGELLWCGENSCSASYLRDLAVACQA